MKNYKNLFPIFKNNPTLHYLDSGATALKPQVVLDKMMEYYTSYSANIHRGLYPMSERATREYEEVRNKVAKFIGAKHEAEIIFTSGTTDSINLVARGLGLKKEDEVVVEIEAHHSNFVVWQQMGKITNYELYPNGHRQITNKTRILAITHVSNVLGVVNNIKETIKKAREINPDIIVVVDGAQAIPHIPVNVADLDCDFYAFSGHKMYGPTGVGVLYARVNRQSEMSPARYGGGMIKEVFEENSTWADGPERFEAGTPPIAQVIGLGAAIDFINKIGFDEIQRHEAEVTKYLFEKLAELKWIKIVGSGYDKNRLGVVAIAVDNIGAHDMADILGRKYNVAVRAGHHCTMPLHTRLGLPYGTTRISLGIYNDKSDIDELINGLIEAWTIFTKN
ncbi:MAG: aminotransferase class V-fold PLP-dependent enzyme [Microgenomates group bacterium]